MYLRLYDGLFEGLAEPVVGLITISNTLHVLILGEKRVADTCEQHHPYQEGNYGSDGHDA